MEHDIVPALLEVIESEFDIESFASEMLKQSLKSLQEDSATYLEVNDFAIEIGLILAKVLKNNLTADILPDGKMYFNIADRILKNTLQKNHELITSFGADVQKSLNEQAGIKIKAQIPDFNDDKVNGLVNRLCAEPFEDVSWLLVDPIVTFSQGIVDDMVKSNVEFHAKSGLSPKIVRRSTGKCCTWCQNLVGVYEYMDEPKDVYRRHSNCRCTVDFVPDKSKKQNVWTKKVQNVETIEVRKQIGLTQKYDDKPFRSVKKEWLKAAGNGKVSDLTFLEHEGVKYYVDGGYAILDHDDREKEVAQILSKTLGKHIQLVPRVEYPPGIQSPDYLINGARFDLKQIEGIGKNVIDTAVKEKKKQANNFVLDVSITSLKIEEINERIERLYRHPHRKWIENIVLLKNNEIIDIFERK